MLVGNGAVRGNAASELIPTLEKAFKLEVPAVIDVPVDYSENTRFMGSLGQFICPS